MVKLIWMGFGLSDLRGPVVESTVGVLVTGPRSGHHSFLGDNVVGGGTGIGMTVLKVVSIHQG